MLDGFIEEQRADLRELPLLFAAPTCARIVVVRRVAFAVPVADEGEERVGRDERCDARLIPALRYFFLASAETSPASAMKASPIPPVPVTRNGRSAATL